MKTIRFQLETLTCPTCITKIEGALNKESGVEEAKVLFLTSTLLNSTSKSKKQAA